MQKTDLNTSPYYDDFDENKDFHRVLFRPGFSVQARELTQLQTILQKQVGRVGNHLFKDGTVVFPGQVGYTRKFYGIKIDLDSLTSEQQTSLINAYKTALAAGDVVIQNQDPDGSVTESSVLRANLLHIEEPTADDPLILYVQYVKAGGVNNDQTVFGDGVTLYSTPSSGTLDDLTTASSSASVIGSSANIQEGVYYIREHFVRVAEQQIILEKYSIDPSARVGLSIIEDLVTPEEDTSLLDNAQGTTNFNAKGAHRLKISLTLAKKDLGSTDDENFVELLSVKNGLIQAKARATEYSVLAETLARRTFDESGNYLVKPFSFNLRENLDDGFNNGLYQTGQTTDDGNTASDNLFNVVVSPGKGYVNGYETELIGKSFIDFEKARDVEIVDDVSSTIELGNYVMVTNTYGSPTLSFSGAQTHVPYTSINLHDSFTNSKEGGNAARGTESSSQTTADGGAIGIARVRGFEKDDGSYTSSVLDSDSQHKLYLFDIKMMTELQMSASLAASLNAGDKVIGQTSKATGFVHRTSGNDIYLISTVGTFQNGEVLKTTTTASTVVDNIVVDSGNTQLTVSSAKTFSFDQVKSVFGQNQSISSYVTSNVDVFTADIITTLTTNNANQSETNVNRKVLTGTVFPVFSVTSRNSLTGTGTKFLTELVVGDILEVATGNNGASEFIQIDEITSDTDANFFVVSGGTDTSSITPSTGYYVFFGSSTASENGLLNVYPAGVSYYKLTRTLESIPATRVRSAIVDQEKNILIRKLKEEFVKELDETEVEYTVRRTYYVTVNNNDETIGTVTGNDAYTDISELDYSVTLYTVGSGSATASAGDNFDPDDVLEKDGSQTIRFKSSGAILTKTGSSGGAVLKIVATIRKEQSGRKSKTLNSSQLLLIPNSSYSDAYGTSAKHSELSLGFADIYNVTAVYESPDASTDPNLPQWTISGVVLGPDSTDFIVGETIKGSTSNAIGQVIAKTTGYIVFVPLSTTQFQASETITGLESGATAVLGSFTDTNSTNIKSNFFVDDGQRDNYYDIGKLIRKPNKPVPTGKLLVVLDYFEHSGSGNFLSVDSYTNQVDFDKIPTYSANRVDPDEAEPSGEFDLADSIDYRPRVSNSAVTSGTTISPGTLSCKEVSDFSLDYSNRFFYDPSSTKLGSSTTDILKDGSTFNYGLSKYLGRIDSLFLSPSGNLIKVKGAPSEEPTEPKKLENSMHIAIIKIPPYTFDTNSVIVKEIEHRRFTMKDIAGIDKRMTNFEYYTALNLLEKETADLEVLDENGLNKFKSGFLVDNFSGHSIGDVGHPDYNNSIDFKNNELRPRFSAKNLKLQESSTTDAQRTSAGYQRTGEFITLPYNHVVSIQQPYASTVEKVNPVLTFSWVGDVKLKPSRDEWFEVGKVQKRVLDVEEGDYDHLVREQDGDPISFQWNSWETVWTGDKLISSTVERVVRESGVRARQGSGRGSRTRTADRVASVNRTVTQNITNQVRVGLKREINLRIDERQVGEDRVINETPILYIRSTDEMGSEIQFTANGLKPRTKVYPFFDKINVSTLVTPDGGSIGDELITNANGTLVGTFKIPDPKVEGNLRFETGEKTFRITSSSTNSNIDSNVETFADGRFISSGILREVGRDVIQTRNATVSITSVSEKQTLNNGAPRTVDVEIEGTSEFINWRDPLAQSFISETRTGEYITKVDVYFSAKDDQNIPVRLEVREMQNGYPSQTILPFGNVSVNASDVNVSADASAATTFTFESPIYIKGGKEYCIVLLSDSNKYLAYISRVGETDIGGTRFISEQPYLGVLFKSQNNSTWNASQLEDLKFTIYRAQFDKSATGNLILTNEDVPNKTLQTSPFECFNAIETFSGDGSTVAFTLSNDLDDFNIDVSNYNTSVLIDIGGVVSTPSTGYAITNGNTLTFTSAPASGTNNITVRYLFNKIKVTHPNHQMYQSTTQNTSGTADNYVTFKNVAADQTNSIIQIDSSSITANSIFNSSDANVLLDASTSYIVTATTGSNSVFKVTSNSAGDGVSSIEVINPGSGFSTGSLILDFTGVTTGNSVDRIEDLTIDLIGDTLFGVPVDLLNADNGIAVKDFGMDYYTIAPSLVSYTNSSGATISTSISNMTSAKLAGGSTVTASENVQFNLMKLLVPTIEHNNTSIETSVRTTSGLSPGVFAGNVTQDSFVTSSNYKSIKIDDNNDFLSPKLIASSTNQDRNMSSKSLFVKMQLKSETEYLSPIIDLDSRSAIFVSNRFSNVDSDANVFPRYTYFSPTEPDGDSGETIYITRKVQLETPARSIKVYFDGLRQATSEFQVLYKILHSDTSAEFDDLGWEYFNNGSTAGTNSDVTVNPNERYLEYTFTETDIDEFIAFSIKIRMQGTNTSEVPKIKNLRVLALAT